MLSKLRRLLQFGSSSRSGKGKTGAAKKTGPGPAASFAGVEIKPAKSACPAALALVGNRYLSDEAPLLPLKDCTAAECKCRYVHYSDRRDDLRRGEDAGLTNTFFTGDDRRSKKRGRRKSDYE